MLMKDKIVIITGGASPLGIGFATAGRMAAEGARVAILDLNVQEAQKAAAQIGAVHRGYACDVRNEAVCQEVISQILDDMGTIDVLVNNAGVSQSHRIMDSTRDDYDLVMDSSVRGTYNMTRAVVPHMRSRRYGSIVCIGSVAAQRGGGILGGPHYTAAKGAVQAMAKALARELGLDGIRVNAIAPGLCDTALLFGKLDEAGKRRVAESTVLGRVAVPADIANACLYLGSDMSSYVTGIILDVNGGLHIH